MSKFRSTPIMLGFALGTMLVVSAASAVESAIPITQPSLPLGARSQPCTLSGDTATGREWGRLIVTGHLLVAGQVVIECSRIRTGGEAPVPAPRCMSRDFWAPFGCSKVVDAVE